MNRCFHTWDKTSKTIKRELKATAVSPPRTKLGILVFCAFYSFINDSKVTSRVSLLKGDSERERGKMEGRSVFVMEVLKAP